MKETEPYKVSILVPVYGVEKYIERCAVSLFEQTYDNIEYIFIDDCGPDHSVDVLRNVMERYTKRKEQSRIIRHEHNRGLAAARNTAVAAATGEFIMHVDSDDYIDKNAVEACVKKQQSYDSDIVRMDVKKYRSTITYDVVTPPLGSPHDFVISLINGSVSHGVCEGLYRKTLYTDNHIEVVEGVNMGEDFQVSPRLAYFAKKVSRLNGIYYHYDIMREGSYINAPFSEDKMRQSLSTFAVLEQFFEDKDKIFRDTLLRNKVNSLVKIRMSASESNNKEWFEKLSQMISEYDNKILSTTPLPYRLTLRFHSMPFLNLYIKQMRKIKHAMGRY